MEVDLESHVGANNSAIVDGEMKTVEKEKVRESNIKNDGGITRNEAENNEDAKDKGYSRDVNNTEKEDTQTLF